MDVKVIFQNSVVVDEKNNFIVEFQDGNTIIDLLLNRKKDYSITNAIIHLDHDNKNVTPTTDLKELEKIAKKYQLMEQTRKFQTIVFNKINLSYFTDNNLSRYTIRTFNYKFNKSQMEKYLKEYNYYNTNKRKIEKFRVYDLLANLRAGLMFDRPINPYSRSWEKPPIESIRYKLTDDDKKIKITSNRSNDQSFIYYMYKWANRILILDTLGRKWHASLTGWVEIYRRILAGLNGFTQSQMVSVLRGAFARYFLDNPKALVISRLTNYQKLTENEKELVAFIVNEEGYLTVNYGQHKYVYVGTNKLRNNFSQKFLGKCSSPAGSVTAFNASIYNVSDIARIPYLRLYKYKITTTFNRDDYWFDSHAYTLNEDHELKKTNS